MTSKFLAGIVGLSLVAAACGGDDDPTADSAAAPSTSSEVTIEAGDESTATTFPETPATTTAGTSVPVTTAPPVETTSPATTAPADDAVPVAIVSLSPTATEMLYAIGAGDQVLAVDDLSYYPEEAQEKIVGISAFTPNVEAVAGLEPDLVITDGTNPDFLAQLDSLGIAHWEGPAATSFDDVYAQIEQLGAITGRVGEAAELVGQMQTDVAAVKDGLPELAEPLTYYHELDPTFFSVTSDTFIGAVYAEIGLINIADAVGDGNPYPQLSQEFIVAEDPDLIFLACTIYCGETAESVAARPGWDALTAVQTGGVIEMNDDIASRWGPRIVEYLQTAGDAVAAVAAAQPAG